jgi:4-amino-4-deoxy-L-arabinose transferase-like glycosyltransferase
MMPRLPNSPATWLAVILVVAAIVRLFPIWFGLPYTHARPDESTAIDLAEQIRRGDFNPRFFHWGSLTLYVFATTHALLSAVRRLLGLDPALTFNELVVSARAVVALAGTATVGAVYVIGRRVGGSATGLLAALLLAVAILHVRESHFAMTDVLMTFFLTTSLALVLEALAASVSRPPVATRSFAAAGFAGGLATATKYSAAAVVTAMAAAQLVLLVRNRSRLLSWLTWLPSAVFGLAFATGFIAGTPYAVLDFRQFESDVWFDITHLSGGHGIDLGLGWIYHLTVSLPYGLGILTFVAALAGIPLMVRRYPLAGSVLLTFAAAFYCSIGSGRTVFFRYVLPLLPVLCVTAAVFIVEASAWIAARRRVSTAAATIGLGLLIAAPSLANSLWFDIVLSRTDSRVLAARWLVPRLRSAETIYDNGGLYAELNLTPARVHRWEYDVPSAGFVNAGDKAPDWLILHESPLNPYARTPVQLLELARTRYDLVFSVVATPTRSRSAVYDRQDAFFMPISDFHSIERPGPTIRIYRRQDLSPRMPTSSTPESTR